MKLYKRVLACAAFLCLLAISLIEINKILVPKYTVKNSDWPTTSTYNQFYRMDRDCVDVLFFGSSIAANAFVPQEIYNDYGITSYNLASEQQSVFLSYYWLKEALRYQKPKLVVLELEFMNYYHPEFAINTKESLTRKCIDPMRWSLNKVKAVHRICRYDKEQSELSYYLTNIRFHSRWNEVGAEDFDVEAINNAPFKGYAPIVDMGPASYDAFVPNDGGLNLDAGEAGQEVEFRDFPPVMREFLDKITDLCESEGIELMLVNLPGATMDDAIYNTHMAYAKEHDLYYVNLCLPEHVAGIGARLPEENFVYHENVWGAQKTSRYLGELICQHYGVADSKAPSGKESEAEGLMIPRVDQQYEETRDEYQELLDNFEPGESNG